MSTSFARRALRSTSPLVALALVAGACGGAESGVTPPGSTGPSPLATAASTAAPGSTNAPQPPSSGGTATLVIGDETWTFDDPLCAFGPEAIGDPDAEFVLSAFSGGLQLYVSIDRPGHSVSLTDVRSMNPSVDWGAEEFGDQAGLVIVSGNEISASAPFIDYTDDALPTMDGTLTATCR